MQFSAAQIASFINGTVEGNPDTAISTMSKIEIAEPGSISFIANPKYEHYLYTTKASVLIVNETLEVTQPVTPTLIRVKDAYGALAKLLEVYDSMMNGNVQQGIESPSFIAPSAKYGTNCYIGAFAYIGENVVIGDNVRIYPNAYVGPNTKIGDNVTINAGVKLYPRTEVGNNCIIHSGTVIGADGFGFAPQADGHYTKVAQVGNVVIEDNVEIGANTCIDRATMGSTVIKRGTKLDNLIQIGHNVELDENVVIAAQTGISGSTKIGKNVLIGGQVGVVGHIQIAPGTKVNAQSGIGKTIKEPNQVVSGSPAFDFKSSLKSQVIFRNLPDILERLEKLEARVQDLDK